MQKSPTLSIAWVGQKKRKSPSTISQPPQQPLRKHPKRMNAIMTATQGAQASRLCPGRSPNSRPSSPISGGIRNTEPKKDTPPHTKPFSRKQSSFAPVRPHSARSSVKSSAFGTLRE